MTTTLDLPHTPGAPTGGATRTPRRHLEPLGAFAAFALFAGVVLTRASALLEPDDYAYRASIAALTHGHILLTSSQYHALAHRLGGIAQWHHLASGLWISEKNPGYPFLAAPFAALHVLRLTPLVVGAVAAVALYHGARAWLGRGAGVLAVWLYCFSGAALTFAWRATMPTFSDASLVAAGAGGLLWTMLRTDAPARRRALVGLASFVALEAAVAVRYTNVVELAVAVVVVAAAGRRCGIARRALATWFTSVGILALAVLGFNEWAYGHATSTGYSSGEISFSLSSLGANLREMPPQLARALPLWLLAALALGWIGARAARRRDLDEVERHSRRLDGLVALALAAGWLGLWGLYLTYSWTVGQAGGGAIGSSSLTVHVIRFYLPALGPIALLAAWALRRVPRAARGTTVALLLVAALLSFHAMAASGGVGAPLGVGHGAPPAAGAPGGGPNGGGPGSAPPTNTRPIGGLPPGAPGSARPGSTHPAR